MQANVLLPQCPKERCVTDELQVEYTVYKDERGQYVDEHHPQASAVRWAHAIMAQLQHERRGMHGW